MIYKIFCVFDSKVSEYNTPFCQKTTNEALRSWSDAVNDQKLGFYNHPEDYTLFEIGTYDGSNAKISMYETPRSLGVAVEFVK